MKHGTFLLKLVSFLVIAGCLIGYQSIAVSRAETVAENEAQIREAENYNQAIRKQMEQKNEDAEAEAPYRDGIYTGSAEGFGGPIALSVTVKDGRIAAIDVTEHQSEDPAYYSLAESVLDAIIETQDVNVDTVSGATFSSSGLICAAEEALSGCRNQ